MWLDQGCWYNFHCWIQTHSAQSVHTEAVCELLLAHSSLELGSLELFQDPSRHARVSLLLGQLVSHVPTCGILALAILLNVIYLPGSFSQVIQIRTCTGSVMTPQII